MKFPRITKLFVKNELYKVCAGYDTSRIIGEYSYKSTWQAVDVVKRLIEVCLERTSLEDICSSSYGPSADTVHKRCAELQIEQVERLVNGWLVEVVSRLRFHKNTQITLAFDLHNQSFYGNRNHDWVVGTSRKKGTNFAVSFLVVSIATDNIRCPVGIRIMTKERLKRKADLVGSILDDLYTWLPVKRVLFDRGFCQESIIQLANERGLKYVIAAIRHSTIKTATQEILTCVKTLANQAGIQIDDMEAVGRWARKKGLDSFRVTHVTTGKHKTPSTLVAVFVRKRTHSGRHPKRRIYALYSYLTNIKVSARRIVKLYSKRWIVETDIRCNNDFKAVTNSTKPQLRLFLYGLSMVLNALWVVFSTLYQRLGRLNDSPLSDETVFPVRQSDILICIARRFLRLLRQEILPELCFRGGDA
ncbi:MAG: transposase [Candidatus Hodarchaeales archaeon]